VDSIPRKGINILGNHDESSPLEYFMMLICHSYYIKLISFHQKSINVSFLVNEYFSNKVNIKNH
jgi:hypothetical protein